MPQWSGVQGYLGALLPRVPFRVKAGMKPTEKILTQASIRRSIRDRAHRALSILPFWELAGQLEGKDRYGHAVSSIARSPSIPFVRWSAHSSFHASSPRSTHSSLHSFLRGQDVRCISLLVYLWLSKLHGSRSLVVMSGQCSLHIWYPLRVVCPPCVMCRCELWYWGLWE